MRRIALFSIFLFFTFNSYSQTIILHDDSKAADFKLWNSREKCCDYSIIRSNEVTYKGHPSIRFELNKTDPLIAGGKRSELVDKNEATSNIDRWYSFNYFIPSSFVKDSLSEIVAQWHEVPDFNLGESWRSPPISLFIQNDKWNIAVKWATDSVNTNSSISGQRDFIISNIKKDFWTRFIFHIKFSYKNDGLLQVWKDGKLVVNYKGPNYYNDKLGPYFKIGIYKWEWNKSNIRTITSKRVFYISNIKIYNKDNKSAL